MSARARTWWTIGDREWLAGMGIGLDAPAAEAAPRPMVSLQMYCAVLDANDAALKDNQKLRRNRRRLWRRYGGKRRREIVLWWTRFGLALAWLVTVLEWIGSRG